MPHNVHTDRAPFGALAQILALDRVDGNTFVAAPRRHPSRRKFGGETMGQAVVAAAMTVAPDRRLHATQTHFLAPADSAEPTEYTVTPLRDGRSSNTRRAEVRQHGRVVAETMTSFHAARRGFDQSDRIDPGEHPEVLPTPAEQLATNPRILAWYTDLAGRGAVDFAFPADRCKRGSMPANGRLETKRSGCAA
ncbi:acyl-CoA thioesterase [Nocardia sp. NPDC047654]|jgi:acyl-CoA thioesterase II|uniref:acyl-CoA thioesterase n=1 Tax=Nocardia sp. NPDC047654 TaxID=3364314 RepID=UPI003713C34C